MSDRDIQRYAVIGDPIEHSMSPLIHQQFAGQFDLSIAYDKIRVSAPQLASWLGDFARSGGRGLNVTVPHKVAAYELVTSADPSASAAGAVNTIAFDAGTGQMRGFNTDGWGMLQDIQQRYGQALAGRRVLMLGAGGAAKGVVAPLLQAGPASLFIANRTPDKAEALVAANAARAGGATVQAVSFDELMLPSSAQPFDIVINATSAGLSSDAVPLPSHLVDGAFCYDMSYGSAAVFCRWAVANGAGLSVDGLGMLVEQAARSFEIWHGQTPDTGPVFESLRKKVDNGPG